MDKLIEEIEVRIEYLEWKDRDCNSLREKNSLYNEIKGLKWVLREIEEGDYNR